MVRTVVGIAEMHASADPFEELVTYALGSCLGITLHDPVAGVGGLLHVMLPDSRIDTAKAEHNPAMFVDTGIPSLFRACYALGAAKPRIVVRVAGGASRIGENEDSFRIGHRNAVMLRRLLWKNGVLIQGEDVGGCDSRTVTLAIASGEMKIRSNGRTRII